MMKTLILTNEEMRALETFLWENPCESGCILDYKIIDCYDENNEGEYRCKLLRARDSILRKIEG